MEFNTTELLNQDDIKVLSGISAIKRDITSYFNMDLFVEKMREVIKQSKNFKFRSTTAELYIEKERPTFILKYVEGEVADGLAELVSNGASNDAQIDYILNHVNTEIIKEFSKFALECVLDNDKTTQLFDEVPELKSLLLSTMYTVRISVEDNNINVLYFI